MKHPKLFLAAAVAGALATAPLALAGGDSARSADASSTTAKATMTDQYSSGSTQSSAAQGSGKMQEGRSAAAKSGEQAALLVLMPITIASTDSLGDGCWVRLYDDQNFAGDRLPLVGPIDMPNMRTAFRGDWSGEFDSVAVGPKARVTVYDNENYSQRVARFEPGQKIGNLGGEMGFFEQIRSLKVSCSNQTQSGQQTQASLQSQQSEQAQASQEQQTNQQAQTGQHVSAADRGSVASDASASSNQPRPLIADPASPQGLRSFAALDKDNDGSISRAEWDAADSRVN